MSNTISYEDLLNRILERVGTGIDTSEGSFLFDAVVPCVAELYQAYLYIDELEKREYLPTQLMGNILIEDVQSVAFIEKKLLMP